jgi:hypothetical protein
MLVTGVTLVALACRHCGINGYRCVAPQLSFFYIKKHN